MGVHANICVLGRPVGIRQLVYLGKKPILCRDLTDSFHRDHLEIHQDEGSAPVGDCDPES